jgi:hypothetical protein
MVFSVKVETEGVAGPEAGSKHAKSDLMAGLHR